MAKFKLPNIQTGTSQEIDASSLGDAEKQAQDQGTWSPGAGTFGADSSPSDGGGGGGGGGSSVGQSISQLMSAIQSGNAAAAKLSADQFNAQLAATIGQMMGTYNGKPTLAAQEALGTIDGQQTLAARQQEATIAQQQAQLTGVMGGSNAIAQNYPVGTVVRSSGGKFAIVGPGGTLQLADASNPTVYQAIQNPGSILTTDDATFNQGLGGQQTLAAQQQAFNQGLQQAQLALQQAGVTGTFNGQMTEAARAARASEALQAMQVEASAQNDPFRQMEVEYGLAGSRNAQALVNGMSGASGSMPGFQAPNGSAQGTGVLGQARSFLGSLAFSPGRVNSMAAPANVQAGGATAPGQTYMGANYGNSPNGQVGASNGPVQQFALQGAPIAPSTWDNTGSNTPTTGDWASGSGQPGTGGQSPGGGSSNAILGRFQSPTDVVARNYVTAPKSAQNMITSAISANTGVSQADADAQIKAQLPKQGGPTFGMAQI